MSQEADDGQQRAAAHVLPAEPVHIQYECACRDGAMERVIQLFRTHKYAPRDAYPMDAMVASRPSIVEEHADDMERCGMMRTKHLSSHDNMIDYLLERGSPRGILAFHRAHAATAYPVFERLCQLGRLDVVQMITSDAVYHPSWHHGFLRACRANHLSLVRHLLSCGVPINHVHEQKTTALMEACRGGHVALADELIAHGADPHARVELVDKSCDTVAAAASPHDALFEKLVRSHRVRISSEAAILYTFSNPRSVQIMIAEGWRPPPYCVENRFIIPGYLDSLRVLVEGSIVEPMKLLHYACRYAQRDIVTYLLSRIPTSTHIPSYCVSDCGSNRREQHDDRINIWNQLFARGCHVDDMNEHRQWTAFFYVCSEGNVSLARYLLDRGASMCMDFGRGRGKCYAIHDAVSRPSLALLRLLFSRGAAMDDDSGTSLLHEIMRREWDAERQECVEELLVRGGSLHRKDKDGFLPIHRAHSVGAFKYLLDRGFSVESAHEKTGMTLLMLSVSWHRKKDMVQYLLSRGANVNATDLNGQTALFYASRQGYREGMELLIRHSPDVVAHRDHEQRTYFHVGFSTTHLDFYFQNGVDITARDHHGRYPMEGSDRRIEYPCEMAFLIRALPAHLFHTPCLSRNRSVVQWCLDANDPKLLDLLHQRGIVPGPDVRVPTSALDACRTKQGSVFRSIVQFGKLNVEETDASGHSCFFYACETGQVDIARMLLALGADARTARKPSTACVQPLWNAIECWTRNLKYLIEHGCRRKAAILASFAVHSNRTYRTRYGTSERLSTLARRRGWADVATRLDCDRRDTSIPFEHAVTSSKGIQLPVLANVTVSDSAIGRGGFGTVRRAVWRGKEIAVKTAAGSCLLEEAATLADRPHDHVVTILGLVRTAASSFGYAMELCQGDILSMHHRLSMPTIVRCIGDAAAALATFVHGDMKPQHILIAVDDGGGPCGVVCDDGSTECMTVAYAPPERTKSAAGDVYSFAKTVLSVLMGTHAMEDEMADGDVLPEAVRAFAEPVLKLVRASMCVDPRARPTMAQYHFTCSQMHPS